MPVGHLRAAALPEVYPGYEVIVDFSDGVRVTLETGADLELGAFGAPSEGPEGAEGFEAILHFAPPPTRSTGKLAARLIIPQTFDPAAAGRRQFILDSSMCAPDGATGAHMPGCNVRCASTASRTTCAASTRR